MKYNDNGTYKDIYVKAFDTLPVGTEVDYDGNTVPTGWTEVADPNTYSTDEVRIGTWFGKPLYRKVFTGQFEGGTSTSTTVSDILPLTCTVRNLYGTTYPSSGSAHRRPINFYFIFQGISSYIGTWAVQDVNNNRWNLAFYYSQGYNTLNYEAVIEYTKTTD